MRNLKNGDIALVTGNVIIRRSDGILEKLHGSRARIVKAGGKSCLCDIGIGKLITLPKENLQVA